MSRAFSARQRVTGNRFARLPGGDQVTELVGAGQRDVVELEEDLAGLELGPSRGRVGEHFLDRRPVPILGRLDPQSRADREFDPGPDNGRLKELSRTFRSPACPGAQVDRDRLSDGPGPQDLAHPLAVLDRLPVQLQQDVPALRGRPERPASQDQRPRSSDATRHRDRDASRGKPAC